MGTGGGKDFEWGSVPGLGEWDWWGGQHNVWCDHGHQDMRMSRDTWGGSSMIYIHHCSQTGLPIQEKVFTEKMETFY